MDGDSVAAAAAGVAVAAAVAEYKEGPWKRL